MDWQRHRAIIMSVVALALVGVTYWAVTSQTGDTQTESSDEPSLPDVERSSITELEIHLPANEDEDLEAITITLVKDGEDWRLSEPNAPASTTAINTALDKISSLEVAGRAATRAQHHERLEVDEAHGLRVIARGGSETLIDIWLGAYRAGNTLVRQEGQDQVLMVRGSIKFAFNKRVRDWRERAIVQLTAGDVHEIQFTDESGDWTFTKNEDAWVEQLPEAVEGEEPPAGIENFDAGRVRTAVASLARLRAADFAEPGADTGLESGYAVVRMVAGEGDDETTTVLHIGNEADEGQRYVQVVGNDTVFLVSRFMADRLVPDAESFQPSDEPETPPPPAGGGMPGMPPGGPGGQISPEIMQQIQRQLQAQGAAGH